MKFYHPLPKEDDSTNVWLALKVSRVKLLKSNVDNMTQLLVEILIKIILV
jgi:hypothetical protein